MTKNIFIVVSLHFTFLFLIQSSFAKVWSLDDCISYAFENNLALKIQKNHNLIVEYNSRESKWSIAPSVSGSAYANFDMRRSTNQNNDISSGPTYSVSPGIRASMNLFNGFRTLNNIKAKALLEQSSKEATKEQMNLLYLNILNQFCDLLFQYELIQIARNKVNECQQQFEELSTLIEVGKREPVALVELQATLSGNKLDLLRAQNNLHLKTIELSQLLQVPYNEEFHIDTTQFQMVIPELKTYTVDGVYEQALHYTPSIKEQEYLLDYYGKQLAIQKGAMAPTLSASGGYNSRFYSTDTLDNGKTTPFGTQIEKYLNPSLGLSLNIPIFNGRSRSYAVKSSKLYLQNQLYTLQNEKNNVLKEVEQAIHQLEVNRLEYENTKEYLMFVEKSYASNKEKFKLGLINSIDFMMAQNQLQIAQINVINTRLSWIVQNSIIKLFIGERP